MDKRSFLTGLVTGIFLSATALLTLRGPAPSPTQLAPTPAPISSATPAPDSRDLAQIEDVLPANHHLGVSFGDTVVRMVQAGAIDKEKFIALYEGRSPLTEAQKQLLDTPSQQEIVVDQKNAGMLLNLLWPLGIANKSAVLAEGPMGTQYGHEVGNFASTGGWDLGKKTGGELFNSLSLVTLTPQQEAVVKEIATHVHRPCCDNHTAFPDCNHGAAMLGFIQLAVAQGMPTDEVYRKALILNSYWFPQTYVELAIYFKVQRNLAWTDIDAKEVLGETYSSGDGAAAIREQLQADGLLPKIDEGGSCGT